MTAAPSRELMPIDGEVVEPRELVAVEAYETTAIEAVNRAEIDQQIATARRWPRQPEQAERRMKAAVGMDPETAAECYYTLPRGGKRIEGPSVRLAEIIAIHWGNLRVVTRPPVVDRKQVTVEWAAHDLESNYATSGSVSTRITRKDGARYDDDMINVACLATTAKARRNGIYAIVPGTIVKRLLEVARKVATGGDQPIEARRERAMSFFRRFGVDERRVLAAVGRQSVEQLTADDLADLYGLANAIRDNHTTIDEAFPPLDGDGGDPGAGGGSRTDRLAERLHGGDAAPSAGPGKGRAKAAPPAPAAEDRDDPPDESAADSGGDSAADSGGDSAADSGGDDAAADEPEVGDDPPPAWHRVRDRLADKAGVAPDAAAERIADFALRMYEADLSELTAAQLDDLAAMVDRGDLAMKPKTAAGKGGRKPAASK